MTENYRAPRNRRYRDRQVITFNDFFEKRPEQKKAPAKKEEKGSGKAHIFRFAVIMLGLVVLLIFTFQQTNVIGLFEDYMSKHNIIAGVTGITGQSSNQTLTLNSKPSDNKGVSSKLTIEQVAENVCPCIVGIVQYQKNSLKESGEGSGILMSDDGYIVTNNHVIDGAFKIKVVTSKGKELEGTLIGRDARTDIAVVKVNADGLQYARFGNSDQVKVGEQVIAIGNPSGLQLAGSVTSGIISALNRNVDVGNGPMNLIQTDAAINPGNSGGALVNMYGQVIGINSAKISQEGYEGIGFSIPIKTAKPVIDSILKYGYVKDRVKFGVNCRTVDEMTAKMNGVPQGVYIEYVDPSSSAAQCGIKRDDIILQINGKDIKSTDDMIIERDKHKPNEEITLKIFRRSTGQTLNIKIRLMEDRGDRVTISSNSKYNGSW